MAKAALHLVIVQLLVFCTAAHANDEGSSAGPRALNTMLTERHVLSVGIAGQKVDARIRATRTGFDPVGVDLDDLGVDNSDTSYYIDYRYRIKPNWTLIGGVYSFNGSGGQVAERSFNFDGVEYEAGAALRADFDIDAYILDVMYTVHRGESFELMAGGGIHALDLGARIAAGLSVGEEEIQGQTSGATLLAPVPNFRASAIWAITDRLAVHAVGGWLSANIDEYSGEFIYGHVRAMYRFTDSLGLALGYQRTKVDVTQERTRSELSFDAILDGQTVTLTYSF
jgi:hypothetical protein